MAANHLLPCRKQVMGVFRPGAEFVAARAWPRAQVCEPSTHQHCGICRQQAAGFSAISQPATGPGPAHAFPACYETSAAYAGLSLTRSYPMMGEEG